MELATTSTPPGDGWSAARVALVGTVSVLAVTAIDALLGPRVVLIGLLIVGPCCGVLTGRGSLTGALSALAIACALVVAVPDGVWFTWEQFAFTMAVVIVAAVATPATFATQRARRLRS